MAVKLCSADRWGGVKSSYEEMHHNVHAANAAKRRGQIGKGSHPAFIDLTLHNEMYFDDVSHLHLQSCVH